MTSIVARPAANDAHPAADVRPGLPQQGTSEAQLVELTDDTIVMDARAGSRRSLFRSTDGGVTWTGPTDGLAMASMMSVCCAAFDAHAAR